MKTIRANLALILLIGAVLTTGIALSFVSQKAHDAQKNVAEKSRDVVAQQWEIRALKAEWAYLNRPDRLEELSDASQQMKTPAIASFGRENLDVSPVSYQTPLPMVKPTPRAAIAKPAPVVEDEKPTSSFSNLLDMIGGAR